MKKIFIIIALFLLPYSTFAYIPEIVIQESLLDITQIENPENVSFFHGELFSFPHTFEINSEKSFYLQVEILVPDINSSKNNISGIIIKEKEVGGVEEVIRLEAEEVEWEEYRETETGNTYRIGPRFQSDLEAGVYRIEVHTPDNLEKYVLKVGFQDGDEKIGYFKKISRIMESKIFFEKTKFSVLESRVIYVPFFGIVFILFAIKKRGKLR